MKINRNMVSIVLVKYVGVVNFVFGEDGRGRNPITFFGLEAKLRISTSKTKITNQPSC